MGGSDDLAEGGGATSAVTVGDASEGQFVRTICLRPWQDGETMTTNSRSLIFPRQTMHPDTRK